MEYCKNENRASELCSDQCGVWIHDLDLVPHPDCLTGLQLWPLGLHCLLDVRRVLLFCVAKSVLIYYLHCKYWGLHPCFPDQAPDSAQWPVVLVRWYLTWHDGILSWSTPLGSQDPVWELSHCDVTTVWPGCGECPAQCHTMSQPPPPVWDQQQHVPACTWELPGHSTGQEPQTITCYTGNRCYPQSSGMYLPQATLLKRQPGSSELCWSWPPPLHCSPSCGDYQESTETWT